MGLTNEVKVEKNSILKYLTDDVDGLGYEERTIHQASKDLFIRSDVMKQAKSEVNIDSFKKVLKEHFNNDEDAFYEGYKDEIKNKLNNKRILNVAILLNESFSFKGCVFVLFNKRNLLSKSQCTAKNNVFAVISQYTHKLIGYDKKMLNGSGLSFSPDLIFFINGIYFSYQELKFLTNGQNAERQGTEQIIEKYFNSYTEYEKQLDIAEKNERIYSVIETKGKKLAKKTAFKKSFLRVFTSAIHITSFDCQNMYMIRDFSNLEQNLINIKKEDRNHSRIPYFNVAKKDFKKLPQMNSWKDYLNSVFAKEMIEREILYYNMVEKGQRLVKNKKGKKVLKDKDEVGTLIAPRPNQKSGADYAISIIKNKLENKDTKNQELEDLKSKISVLPLEVQKEIIDEHSRFKNNKVMDSILLAYAAGFGKTNIIGWLSLLIKDLTIEVNNKVEYAYETIFLITDRIELKEQINQKMRQMNVEKGLVEEVKRSADFKKILAKKPKIVIVNIQKFTNIKNLFSGNDSLSLKNKRNVFIIDEIHRSNNGDQHDDMMSLFTDVVSDNGYKNKNLLIGLTATPSEETLLKFGEYSGYGANGQIIYKPHDSYSMKESIEDGFTLPFENKMTTVSIPMEMFEKSRKIGTSAIDGEKIKSSKNDIYENEDRCEFISKDIVNKLFNNVYRQIWVGKGGKHQGKAMLACYSIQTALHHKYYIDKYKDEVCDKVINDPSSSPAEVELYKKYKETGIYIVYSDSIDKRIPKAKDFNNGDDERTTINNFKNNRNGIIIVVDKLQTGFDEKKIHTIFLNTEKRGIGLIQLLSRGNRTLKGKLDCHSIDYSHDNVNFTTNLPAAWEKYGGEIYSKTNIVDPMTQLKADYLLLTQEQLYYSKFKRDYVKSLKDDKNPESAGRILEIERQIRDVYKDNIVQSNNLQELIFSYFRNLKLVDFVLEIDKKYKSPDLKLFYRKLLNLFSNFEGDFNGTIVEIGYLFDDGGDIIEEQTMPPPDDENGGDGSSHTTDINITSLIDLFNENEALKNEKIENFKHWQKLIIEFIFEKSKEDEKIDLISQIEDNDHNEKLVKTLEVLINKSGRKPDIKKEVPKEFFVVLKDRGIQYFLEILKEMVR